MEDLREYEPPVVNWDLVSDCPFAVKEWVMPNNVDVPLRKYQKGSFPRAYCAHDVSWCFAEISSDCCSICQDHLAE